MVLYSILIFSIILSMNNNIFAQSINLCEINLSELNLKLDKGEIRKDSCNGKLYSISKGMGNNFIRITFYNDDGSKRAISYINEVDRLESLILFKKEEISWGASHHGKREGIWTYKNSEGNIIKYEYWKDGELKFIYDDSYDIKLPYEIYSDMFPEDTE